MALSQDPSRQKPNEEKEGKEEGREGGREGVKEGGRDARAFAFRDPRHSASLRPWPVRHPYPEIVINQSSGPQTC
jgi:hypothetical protein